METLRNPGVVLCVRCYSDGVSLPNMAVFQYVLEKDDKCRGLM